MMESLRVVEILRTLQGESTFSGLPCILVRLAGCSLDCAWCDTRYARDPSEGQLMEPQKLLETIATMHCTRVELTGGEPMYQAGAPAFLRLLCEEGYTTLLETNGAMDLSGVDPRVHKIVDVKCPSSGEAQKHRWKNMPCLTPRDELKFVLADRADYEYAREVLARPDRPKDVAAIFSPVWGRLSPRDLADWILHDGLEVRLGLQLHKIIWPDKPRGA